MPYSTINDLPDSVTNTLPVHAQELFLKVFNHAWEEYNTPEKRQRNKSREETSFSVAWAAVKKKYEKKGDCWIKK